MKRSEYREKRIVHHEQAMGYYCRGGASAEGRTAVLRADLDIEAAEAAGVAWDPEEPEGFREWFEAWDHDGVCHIPDLEEMALLAWNACLAHAKAKPRTGDRQGQWFDGMSFEEIDAHLETGTFPDSGSWVEVPSGFMTWKARHSRHEAQQRTIEAPVDPEVRRKEIEAQIEAWAGKSELLLSPAALRLLGRALAQRLGAL